MNQSIKNRIKQLKSGQIPKGYCKSAIGIIPEDWEIKKINAISEVNPKSQELKNEFLYIDLESVVNGKLVNENIIKKHNAPSRAQRILEKNDIIFQLVRPYQQNNFLYLKEQPLQVVASTGYAQIRTNDFGYLYQYLNFSTFCNRVLEKCTGTNYPAINSNDFSELFIALPSKRERDKIAKILAKWDEAIELQERLIEKFEIQKKGLMKKLLMPKKDWKIELLQNVVNRQKATAVQIHNKGKYPIIDMEYYLNKKYINYTNDAGLFVDENDVILLWDGAGAGTSIFGVKGMLCSTFVKLVPTSILNAGFLYYFLCYVKDKNNNLREGSGIPHMPKDFFKIQKIFLPKIDTQISIYKSLSFVDKNINLHSQKLELFKKQRKALMQLLLTGTVRVSKLSILHSEDSNE